MPDLTIVARWGYSRFFWSQFRSVDEPNLKAAACLVRYSSDHEGGVDGAGMSMDTSSLAEVAGFAVSTFAEGKDMCSFIFE